MPLNVVKEDGVERFHTGFRLITVLGVGVHGYFCTLVGLQEPFCLVSRSPHPFWPEQRQAAAWQLLSKAFDENLEVALTGDVKVGADSFLITDVVVKRERPPAAPLDAR